jgi:hypothetical protein
MSMILLRRLKESGARLGILGWMLECQVGIGMGVGSFVFCDIGIGQTRCIDDTL